MAAVDGRARPGHGRGRPGTARGPSPGGAAGGGARGAAVRAGGRSRLAGARGRRLGALRAGLGAAAGHRAARARTARPRAAARGGRARPSWPSRGGWRSAAARGWASAGMRARVALVTELPIGLGVADGPLALAIASRRDLARDWIAVPLHRLAAVAPARGAPHRARRARGRAQGRLRRRPQPARLPVRRRRPGVGAAPRRPRVARVAPRRRRPRPACALGAGHGARHRRRAGARRSRPPSGGARPRPSPPTPPWPRTRRSPWRDGPWRRACSSAIPGAASAFVWGLPRAAEAEREAAEELLDRVLEHAHADIGEAVVELRAELGDSPLTERASARALALLAGASPRVGRRRRGGAGAGGGARSGTGAARRRAAPRPARARSPGFRHRRRQGRLRPGARRPGRRAGLALRPRSGHPGGRRRRTDAPSPSPGAPRSPSCAIST